MVTNTSVVRPRVLFLDFDGPLFSELAISFDPRNGKRDQEPYIKMNKWGQQAFPNMGLRFSYLYMDPSSVGMLNKLHELHKYTTVISSTWAEFCTKEMVEYLFSLNGLELDLHDDWSLYTAPDPLSSSPYYSGRGSADRAAYAAYWLARHYPDQQVDWLALDDRYSGRSYLNPTRLSQLFQPSFGVTPDERVIMVPESTGMHFEHYSRMSDMWSSQDQDQLSQPSATKGVSNGLDF